MNYSFRHDDLKSFISFITIVEHGGFKQASLVLNEDLSTLSWAIKNLESRLGCELCKRGRGGFGLTNSGRYVYEQSKLLMGRLDSFESHLNAIPSSKPMFTLGVYDNILNNASLKFSELIVAFQSLESFSGIKFRVVTPCESQALLLAGKLDALLSVDNCFDSTNVHSNFAFVERQTLFGAKCHPQINELLTNFNHTTRRIPIAFASREHDSTSNDICRSLNLVEGVICDSVDSSYALIKSGLYVGFLPTHCVDERQDPEIMPIMADKITCNINFYLSYLPSTATATAYKLILKHLHASGSCKDQAVLASHCLHER